MRCHITDAGAVTPDIVIHDVEEIGGSMAHHPHELRRERERRHNLLEPPGACVRRRHEAVGEPVVRWQRRGQRQPSGAGEVVNRGFFGSSPFSSFFFSESEIALYYSDKQ